MGSTATPGQLNGKTNANWARVAFATRTISGLSSELKGVRATCDVSTHWALALTSNEPSSYSTWTHFAESYTSNTYGFHPSQGGTVHSGCSNGCSGVAWSSTTSFELRLKSDGYVDYAICSSSVGGTCSIMATSASAVSVWPLHFGISIYRASVFDPTCSNIQWLSAAEAATW